MAYTNTTRLLGLSSGMDTESLVTQLMNAESMKLKRYQRNVISLTWKQESYRSVGTELTTFQNTFLSLTAANSVRLPSTYKAKLTTIKNSAGETSNAITVGSGAKDGTYSVKVKQLATADLYQSTSKVGGNIQSAKDYKLDVSEIGEGASYEFSLDGASRKVSFNKGDKVTLTVDGKAEKGTLSFENGEMTFVAENGTETAVSEGQFVEILNQKLKTAFGVEGSSGKQKIEAKLTDGGGLSVFTNGYHTGFSIKDGGYLESKATAATSTAFPVNEDRTISFNVNYKGEDKTISLNVTAGMTQTEVIEGLNGKLKDSGIDSRLLVSEDTEGGKITLTGNSLSEKLTISGDGLKELGFQQDEITLGKTSPLAALGISSGAAAKFSTDKTVEDIFGNSLTGENSFTINGKEFTFNAGTKMSEIMETVNSAGIGVKMSYDEYNEVFKLESTKTGYVNRIEMSGEFLTKNLGFGTTAKVEAQDAVAVINGVEMTRESNSFEFEGISLTLNKLTGMDANGVEDELTVSVSRDTDGIVDKIKKFVEAYNSLIDMLNKTANTSRPKSNGNYYEPLLDDEKAEMSEAQITQWEGFAKEGLLYGDDIIKGVMQDMRTAMYQSVKLEDGSSIALHELGITTGDWREGGKLQIDEEKLRKVVSERGDDVMTLFTKSPATLDDGSNFAEQGIAYKINQLINKTAGPNGSIAKKAGIKGYSSESDNLLYKQIKNESNRIDSMLDKLADKEEYYYSMFSRMESAMAKANSQMQYLQSLTGGA